MSQCSGMPERTRPGTDWEAVMAFEIIDGLEMTCDQIADIAGVTKQAVSLVEQRALRKLARNAAALRIEREWRTR